MVSLGHCDTIECISIIVEKMNSNYKPLIVAVFLGIAGLVSGFWCLPKPNVIEQRGILGGPSSPAPILVSVAQGAEVSDMANVIQTGNAVVINNPPTPNIINVTDAIGLTDSAIKDPGTSIGPAFDRSGMVAYTVQKGDSLANIASYFGVSVGTIASANSKIKAGSLKAGETLEILPTSGVVYETQSGDTLASISSNFNIPQDKILQFNQSVNFSSLQTGTSIIIPGGTNAHLAAAQKSTLPNFNNKFIMPAEGYNWGILHNYNAVDIANSCGTPVVASADGLVVPDENIPDTLGGWNGGYGNFVMLEHAFGNGIRTRYAHLEQILVHIGDYVKQGQEIGLMGESGESTGCHVHFEVIGAQNPFVK